MWNIFQSIGGGSKKFVHFMAGAFSDGGDPSSSRIISAVCALAVIAWGTHVVMHTHALPDPVALTSATAFSTSHYVANRVTTAWGKPENNQSTPPTPPAQQ